jgi:AraC-like DNA-binding protein
MRYELIKPPGILKKYIRAFWILEGGEGSSEFTTRYRLMSDNCPNMVFHYDNNFSILNNSGHYEKPSGYSFIHGQTCLSKDMETLGSFGIIGVYFYPYATQRLLHFPAGEIRDMEIENRAIFGKEAGILEEKIITASNNTERLRILSDFFTAKLADIRNEDRAIEYGVREIVGSKGLIKIETIAHTTGISTRQFERRFKATNGIGPKLFSRVSRFLSTLKFQGIGKKSLTSVAHECGYSDQSHFIREFREFSGMSPKEYFLKRIESADNFTVI